MRQWIEKALRLARNRDGNAVLELAFASGMHPGGWRLIRRLSAVSITWILFIAALPGLSQSVDNAEYPLKLALLYKFAQFVEWPPDAFPNARSPLVVCVVGEDPFQADLKEELRTRSVGSHRVEVAMVKRASDLRACHVVFITAAEKKYARAIVASARAADALTVGETKGFAQDGGIIRFTIDANKLSFEINLDAARQSRLKISSKLLALAKIVQNESSSSASTAPGEQ
jgi:hypothetical protein